MYSCLKKVIVPSVLTPVMMWHHRSNSVTIHSEQLFVERERDSGVVMSIDHRNNVMSTVSTELLPG